MTAADLIYFDPNWPEPDLTLLSGSGELPSVPPFPLETLGAFWSGFVLDSAGDRLPRDFFAMSILGTASGLIGNGLEAVMPAPLSVRTPATLWTINVGQPGAGKTPAFQPFLDAVNDLEETYQITRKVEDTTIAGVIKIADQTPEGLVVMNDELSGWWDTFNRDRQGEQFWLKAWNGNSPYSVTRGGRGASLKIDRLNIAVVGGAQPATLPTMLQATGGVERGFAARCLLSYPDRPSGQQATGKAPDLNGAKEALERVFALPTRGLRSVPVTKDAADFHELWKHGFNASALWISEDQPEGQLINKQFGTAIRLALVLETIWWSTAVPPDQKVLTKAAKLAALADPQRNDNVAERRNAQSKLDALVDKHGLTPDGKSSHNPAGPARITLRSMKTACGLIKDYFHQHFVRCQESAYSPVKLKAAQDLVRKLVKEGADSFNAREVQKYEAFGSVNRALHGKGSDQVMQEVCDYLEERNIIRRRVLHAKGRPAKTYDVNPLLAVRCREMRR